MKTRRLTKKYKNKRNRKSIKSRKIKNKSIKIKNKSRRRILKGGVLPTHGVVVRRTIRYSRDSRDSRGSRGSRGSSKPTGVLKRSSISSISSRPSDITSDCCSDVALINRRKIIRSIGNKKIANSFPDSFETFYNELIDEPDGGLADKISSVKESIIRATTIQPEGAYLNIIGLKFVNYLRSKYVNASPEQKEKIGTIISLFDQHAMSQGVRYSDLEVIKKQLNLSDFECYKKLYEEIYAKLFKYEPHNKYPVSVSAIPLYCRPKFNPTLQTISEHIPEV
jgi:hypothetical protein